MHVVKIEWDNNVFASQQECMMTCAYKGDAIIVY